MKRKKPNKKPPSGATEGGKSENELSGGVFYANNSINPANCKTDLLKLADVYETHAEVYRLLAAEARLRDEQMRYLAVIAEGGTVYPLRIPK